jgi:hypothetical protein
MTAERYSELTEAMKIAFDEEKRLWQELMNARAWEMAGYPDPYTWLFCEGFEHKFHELFPDKRSENLEFLDYDGYRILFAVKQEWEPEGDEEFDAGPPPDIDIWFDRDYLRALCDLLDDEETPPTVNTEGEEDGE